MAAPPDPPSVPLPSPLFGARFLHRPNRFVVHARLRGRPFVPSGGPVGGPASELPDGWDEDREVVCHMADPGRLRELLRPGRRLLLRHAPEPHRSTRWSVVLVEGPGTDSWVSVDTTLPNRLVEVALRRDALEEFRGWRLDRREFRDGTSRLDFLLKNERDERLALEVKSVTLTAHGEGLFPDAVTARGTRHAEHLAGLAGRPGWEAALLFVLQRSDADSIRAAHEIDPEFADALAAAREAGVRVLGRRCRVGLDRVTLGRPVPAG